MTDRRRDYFFTLNNYEEGDYDNIKSYIEQDTDYGLLCREIAPTTGTKHLHFYFYFKNKKTFTALKKLFPRANIQGAKGTPQQVKDYISKTDTEFFEYGEMPKQGKRNDIQEVLASVRSGETMRDIIPKATSLQSIKVAEVCLKYFEKKRDFKPMVYWYYGSTGTGKTRQAYEQFPDAYEKKSETKWWDGYDAHESVIIDDFRKHHIDFVELLKLLDRYPCKVEVKGGFRQLLARNIVITAPQHPKDMYEYCGEDVEQLLRRIDCIKLFSPIILETKEDAPKDLQKVKPKKKVRSSQVQEITVQTTEIVGSNCEEDC